MQDTTKDQAWSVYWAQNKLHSCVATGDQADQAALNELWGQFASSLDPVARVLDLATGNGAVPSALLTHNSKLHIDAVDQADIDPVQYLEHSELVSSVNFHSQTSLFDMPFDEQSFDAVTSQFGIEYADLLKATQSVLKYLNTGGVFQFVVHHADSDIIKSSAQKMTELEQLTQEGGLLKTLILVLKGELAFSALEVIGQDYLEQDYVRTQQISGQIFSGIEQISQLLMSNQAAANKVGVSMVIKVEAELARLKQMATAARSTSQMNSFITAMKGVNVELQTPKEIYLDNDKQDYLLAWLIKGSKSEV